METWNGGGWAIDVRGLFKAFGSHPALRGIDLRLERGRLLVLFGPNGAGKTTLLKVLATAMKPTAGGGEVLGFDLLRQREEIRKQIGVLAHGTHLYEDLTALENLHFFTALRGIDGGRERILKAIEVVELNGSAELRVRTFSSGMKRRLALAKLMLADPELLFLDEPLAGLDQQAMKILERYIVSLKERGRSIIMSTHSMTRGYDLSDRIAIVASGRIVFTEEKAKISLEELKRVYAAYTEEV